MYNTNVIKQILLFITLVTLMGVVFGMENGSKPCKQTKVCIGR